MSQSAESPDLLATAKRLVAEATAAEWRATVAEGYRAHLRAMRHLLRAKELSGVLKLLGVGIGPEDLTITRDELVRTATRVVENGVLTADDPAVADLLPK